MPWAFNVLGIDLVGDELGCEGGAEACNTTIRA